MTPPPRVILSVAKDPSARPLTHILMDSSLRSEWQTAVQRHPHSGVRTCWRLRATGFFASLRMTCRC